jgi:hypothetical protein
MEESVFTKQINQYLSPQRPIKSPEHLKGRDIPLKELDRAIGAGATIFIYGDRGVGKTSLAQTSAFKHHPADSSPIFLSCDKISNALYLVRELVAELINNNPLAASTGQMKLGANVGMFSGEKTFEGKSARDIPEPKSVNEAVTLLNKAVEEWNPRKLDKWPVVVIDEFDRMSDQSQREFLGDLLKQIGDREVPIHMIFCGVGRSLDDLLQSHPSVYRYIQSVRLDRLVLEARVQILEHAAQGLEIPFRRDQIVRIGIISDGFPYYVHLLGAKVAWEYHDDAFQRNVVTTEHFNRGIDNAVLACEEHIRKMYEQATQKYKLKYEYVLWAAAAHSNLQRPSSEIFEDYCWIIETIRKRTGEDLKADRRTFNSMMNALKKDSHGKVLVGTRAGWYEFDEPLLRGYCRLMAKKNGVDIGPEQ